MKECYPSQFESDGECKFKFTGGQKRNWMEREGFSHRRTTTKKRKNLSSEDTVGALTKFQLDTRVFQLTATSVKPTNVFNRDQVPMALADSYSTTIDEKNKSVI